MQNIIPRPASAPPERLAAFGRTALLLIDLQSAHRHHFSYDHGTVEDGVRRTISVIEAVRSLGLPILLVTGESAPEIIPEIRSAAGRAARVFQKTLNSAFTCLDLLHYLNECARIDALIVGGWARHLCVRETVLDALGESFLILTSDQLVFGKGSSEAPMLDETNLRGFAEQLFIFQSAEDLVACLRRREGGWRGARP